MHREIDSRVGEKGKTRTRPQLTEGGLGKGREDCVPRITRTHAFSPCPVPDRRPALIRPRLSRMQRELLDAPVGDFAHVELVFVPAIDLVDRPELLDQLAGFTELA